MDKVSETLSQRLGCPHAAHFSNADAEYTRNNGAVDRQSGFSLRR